LSVDLAGYYIFCDDYIFSDLEVEHSGADEVGGACQAVSFSVITLAIISAIALVLPLLE